MTDPESDWLWHMWRSKPEGDPLADYWRGRWEQRVRERASLEARSDSDPKTERPSRPGQCPEC